MNRRTFLTLAGAAALRPAPAQGQTTEVSIRGPQFLINGKPTYQAGLTRA